jgi:protein-disulfide isomerase
MSRKSSRNKRARDQAPSDRAPAAGAGPSKGRAARKTLLIIVPVVILLLVSAVAVLVRNAERSDATNRATQANESLLVRMYSPTLGNPEAKVHIVEFLDPACETCSEFYPLVKKFMAENPNRIRLSVRYAPFHNGSDQVVKILEAARKQGKFWETLEAVFASQQTWAPHHTPQPQLVWGFIGNLGLNLDQLKRDMEAPEIAGVIVQDLADARALKVSATPEFFVNGKPMPSFGYEQLKQLVDDALASAYR